MMRTSLRLLLCAALPFAVANCATLFGSHTKDLALTTDPAGAEVFVDGNRVGTAPVTFNVDNNKSHIVTFKMDGYHPATCTMQTATGAGWIILDVLGGLIPVIIDAATGDWDQLKGDGCHLVLDPIKPAATAESN